MIIVTDKHERENEGDVLFLADRIRPEQMDFMIRHACGLVCVPVSSKIAARLGLEPMVASNSSTHATAFTVSVDAANGGTGISAADRTEAVRIIASPDSGPADLVRPGHIFPLIAKDGGVFERDGHTEAAVELARLCGASEAAVICEIVGKDFGMAEGKELTVFAEEHGLGILSIEDLKDYLTEPGAESMLPLEQGDFTIETFVSDDSAEPVVVLRSKTECSTGRMPVRIHSECFTGDVLGSRRCDCGSQLEQSIEFIAANGGLLIYLRQEGRGIGLTGKVKAYKLQEAGVDTWQANVMLGYQPDERDYGRAVSILKYYGYERIALLTNNPDKLSALEDAGFNIKRIPLEIEPGDENLAYLKTKKEKFNHMILQGEVR
jgi:3,4-dihydroxy 2-butanone 4-phosphate synthase/GTP cyclohydrolase II